MLEPAEIPNGYLELYLKFGFSSSNSDFDNPVKCFVDCLQKRYGFNDKMIKRCIIDVDHVKKGNEFIEWEMKDLLLNEERRN
jgi:Holliday junction resolvase RusA-like endonuclease